jgi:hypothetical protein
MPLQLSVTDYGDGEVVIILYFSFQTSPRIPAQGFWQDRQILEGRFSRCHVHTPKVRYSLRR